MVTERQATSVGHIMGGDTLVKDIIESKNKRKEATL